MLNLMDADVVDEILAMTPGAVVVSYGGVEGHGHSAHVPAAFGQDAGVVTSEPSVVIANGRFPDIVIDDETGVARGIGRRLRVGDSDWFVRGIEPGEAPGEIRVMLTNRENG